MRFVSSIPTANINLAAQILKTALASAPGNFALGIGRYHSWNPSARSRLRQRSRQNLYPFDQIQPEQEHSAMTEKELAAAEESVLTARAELYRLIAEYAREAGVEEAASVFGFSIKDIEAMACG